MPATKPVSKTPPPPKPTGMAMLFTPLFLLSFVALLAIVEIAWHLTVPEVPDMVTPLPKVEEAPAPPPPPAQQTPSTSSIIAPQKVGHLQHTVYFSAGPHPAGSRS